MDHDRLFVPLKSEFFQAFKDREKEWELRGVNDQFNQNTVEEERVVELRKGYSGNSIWGFVEDIRTFDSIDEVADHIPFQKIDPAAESRDEFVDRAKEILSTYDRFIAFKVDLDDDHWLLDETTPPWLTHRTRKEAQEELLDVLNDD